MAVIKFSREKDPYTRLRSNSIQDANLSWKARGLFAYLHSLPADWEVRVSDLINRAPDGRTSVYAALSELKDAGYIEKITNRSEGRISGIDYIVYDSPQVKRSDNLSSEILHSENLNTENQPLHIIQGYKENKVTKKTAAKERAGSLPIAAAAKKQTVALIGDELTSCQKACIAEKLEYLKVDTDKSILRDEIEAALLDKNAFKKTGNDFAYKLNAILKQIKQGAWSRPADILQEEEKEAKRQVSVRDELQYAVNNAATEITHWERMCSMHKVAGAKQHQKTAEKLIGNAKRAYQEALLALQSFDKQEGQQCG